MNASDSCIFYYLKDTLIYLFLKNIRNISLRRNRICIYYSDTRKFCRLIFLGKQAQEKILKEDDEMNYSLQ